MNDIEERLRTTFRDVARTPAVEPNRDLFARVTQSVEADRERRRQRRSAAAGLTVFALVLAAIGAAPSDYTKGRIEMPWWTLELLTTIVLLAIAAVLGPFIKRFGRSYAADVFRANPRTGKSYLVLTDVAYYLIFLSYIMFTSRFEPAGNWGRHANAEQVRHEVVRTAGILLLLGLLHAANIVMLPVIGRMLSLNRKLDDETAPTTARDAAPAPAGPASSIPAGSWVLRIEPAPPAPPGGPTPTTEGEAHHDDADH